MSIISSSAIVESRGARATEYEYGTQQNQHTTTNLLDNFASKSLYSSFVMPLHLYSQNLQTINLAKTVNLLMFSPYAKFHWSLNIYLICNISSQAVPGIQCTLSSSNFLLPMQGLWSRSLTQHQSGAKNVTKESDMAFRSSCTKESKHT